MGDLNALDDNFYYPLYESEEQRCRYAAGHVTHKLPSEMNRRERRRVLKAQCKRDTKEAEDG